VDAKTVREYYQILVDTLLGRFVEPFKKRQSRQVITKAPKFYLFDVGVAGAFEHFIFMEITAHAAYSELGYDINFWRTKSGLEVDFVLGGGEVAIEVKGQGHVGSRDMKPLAAFIEEYSPGQGRSSGKDPPDRSRRRLCARLILPDGDEG